MQARVGVPEKGCVPYGNPAVLRHIPCLQKIYIKVSKISVDRYNIIEQATNSLGGFKSEVCPTSFNWPALSPKMKGG
jgi:hypothetical protein